VAIHRFDSRRIDSRWTNGCEASAGERQRERVQVCFGCEVEDRLSEEGVLVQVEPSSLTGRRPHRGLTRRAVRRKPYGAEVSVRSAASRDRRVTEDVRGSNVR
jgi:hypothetical protein